MGGYFRVEVKVVSKTSLRSNGSIGTNSALNAAAYISADVMESRSIKMAAYISGAEMHCDQEVIADYSNKKGVLFSDVVLPEGAPKRLQDPEVLWNEVEKLESKRKDSSLFREWICSFEKHLTMEEKMKVAKEYAESLASEGMAVFYAIHLGHDGNDNDHVHYMGTVRGFENGEWKKRRVKPQEYILDENGNRIPIINKSTGEQKKNKDGSLRWKKTKVQYEDAFNQLHSGNVERWRKRFADLENQYLSDEFKVTADSYVTQGIDKIPGKHLGKAAYNMQQKLETQVSSLSKEMRTEYLERILKQVQSDYRKAYYENSRALSQERNRMNTPESAEHRALRNEITRELHKKSKYRPQKKYLSNFLGNGHLRIEHALCDIISYYKGIQNDYENDTYADVEMYLKATELVVQAENYLIITFTTGLTRPAENFIVQNEHELKKELLRQLGEEIRETEKQIMLLGRVEKIDENGTEQIEQQLSEYSARIAGIRNESFIDAADRITEHTRAIRESQERLAEFRRRTAESARQLSAKRSRPSTKSIKKIIRR